ncbi:MAG TPA: class I SAM-dependent methyltransferase [Cyclobacteriaceae bacterium]|nr:class I SAM-dependent methyltransferase [Cyclobacteriaceae bacterium]
MNREYYLKYYGFEKNHWWFRARAEILRAYILRNWKSKPGSRILNVGAATGGSIEWLGKIAPVTSLEFDAECVSFIKDTLKAEVIQGSILSLPFASNSFDLVVAFDVIEHVDDDVKALDELARVCSNGGTVLVTVPACMKLWSDHDIINEHKRRYDTGMLKAKLNGMYGGKLTFISYFNNHFYYPILVARKVKNFISRILKNTPRSDFETFKTGWLNGLFFLVMSREKERIARRRAFGKGTSILAHWKKD